MSVQNPATFLELCQRTASECSTSLTGPSAVTSQTGRLGQIVNWVNSSWMDVQTRYDNWKFMRASFTVNTVADDGKYLITDCTDVASSAALTVAGFRRWELDTFKIYLVSAGVATETDLRFMEYQDWYERWNYGSPTSSYPGEFTIDHDRAILLAPKPDGIYTVRGEYMKAATLLSGDSDEPEMPAEYRMTIVYRAMMKYGRYNSAPEVFADGQAEYTRLMREMSRTQRPADLVGGPLA
jgi:hypothetical protein